MAERNEKVYERVRQELGKNADLGSRELYEMAKRADGSLSDSMQQFHARYVLPLKRAQGGGKSRGGAAKGRRAAKGQKAQKASTGPARRGRGAGRGATKAESARDHARSVLLRFAQDFSAAETKTEIVKVMSRLDDYVDQLSQNGS